ncbi:MAG: hypothetical protein H6617_12140 [Bdellovibrionaceae bacterium]|nr:hypothetical protein [Bdellovibrionales bacterium]MCB9255424.1 hypothetical protein [Pseudobdellovibrionaceae bacterium]
MRRRLTIIAFLLLFAASAGAAKRLRCDINDFLVRAVSRATGIEILRERLVPFSRVPLIRDLEAIHAHLFQDNQIRNRTFNLLWVYRDADATELLLSAFNETLVEYSDDSGAKRFLTAPEFADAYEKCFLEAGGTVAPNWRQRRVVEGASQSDRTRFLKRIYLELAYRHQRSLDARSGQQPANFTAAANSDLSYLASYAELYNQFGGEGSFRRAYEKFARRQERVRTQVASWQMGGREYRRVRRELIGAGLIQAGEGGTSPIRRADAQARDRENLLQQVAEAIALNTYPQGFELAAALTSTTNAEGESQFQLHGTFYEDVRRLGYGNLDAFVRELNERLEPPLYRGAGISSWVQELVVQSGALHTLSSGRPFPGFHTADSSDVFYVNMGSAHIRASGLDLVRLNRLVAERVAAHAQP